MPPSLWLGHRRRFGLIVINVSNVGRAMPSFAILVIGTQILGLAREAGDRRRSASSSPSCSWPIPPIVTNTYVGMAEVPDDVRDAARGMGLSDRQVLWRVEAPLAVPLIMAGIRTSAVQVVATATIAAQLGFGGLGRFIIDGFAIRSTGGYTLVLAGAFLVAVLALVTEGGPQRRPAAAHPPGLRPADLVVAPARPGRLVASTTRPTSSGARSRVTDHQALAALPLRNTHP